VIKKGVKPIRFFCFFLIFVFYMDSNIVIGWSFVFFLLCFFIGMPTYCICCKEKEKSRGLLTDL